MASKQTWDKKLLTLFKQSKNPENLEKLHQGEEESFEKKRNRSNSFKLFKKKSDRSQTEFQADEEQVEGDDGSLENLGEQWGELKRSNSMPSLKRSASLSSIRVSSLKRSLSRSEKKLRKQLDEIEWNEPGGDQEIGDLMTKIGLTEINQLEAPIKPHKPGKLHKSKNKNQPEYYIDKLSRKSSPTKYIEPLKACLTSQPSSWIRTFLDGKGLNILIEWVLKIDTKRTRSTESHSSDEDMKLILSCIKMLVNTKAGIRTITKIPDALGMLFLAFDSQASSDQKLVLEIMILMCYVNPPHGQKLVLQACDFYQQQRNEDSRFETLVSRLKATLKEPPETVADFQASVLMFINALVTNEEDLNARFELRTEFTLLGLSEILETCKSTSQRNVLAHICSFYEEHLEDYETFINDGDLESVEEQLITNLAEEVQDSFVDVKADFKRILLSLVDTPLLQYFESIIKNFATLATGSHSEEIYWHYLDSLVADSVPGIPKKNGSFSDLSSEYLALGPRHHTDRSDAIAIAEINFINEIQKLTEVLNDTEHALSKEKEKSSEFEDRVKTMSERIQELEEAEAQLKSQLESENKELKRLQEDITQSSSSSGRRLQKVEMGIQTEVNSAAWEKILDLALMKFEEEKSNDPKLSAEELKRRKEEFSKRLGFFEELIAKSAAQEALEKAGQDEKEKETEKKEALPTPPPPAPAPPPPPPPPGPGMGMPPPPPPPPPGLGGPPPPPPPGGFGMFGIFAPDPNAKLVAKTKMKTLFWEALPQQKLKTTVWQNKEIDNKYYRELLSDEFLEFETLFTAAKQTKKEKDDKTQAKEKKEQDRVSVIDPKKAYNLALMLGSLKLDPKAVKKSLIQIETTSLTEILLTNLLSYAPTDEELRTLMSCETPEKLAAPDYFLFVLTSVPRLEGRLKAIIYLIGFDTKIAEFKPKLVFIKKTCESLMNSSNLGKLLEIVLVFGNYMNGSQRQVIQGFRISALNKLADTKSTDSKMSLLQFLVTIIEKRFSGVEDFQNDLKDCSEVIKVPIDALAKELEDLRSGIKRLKEELKHYKDDSSNPDRFFRVFSSFTVRAKAEIDVLEIQFKETKLFLSRTIEYFGENPEMVSQEEFFAIFSAFLENYQKAKKENDEALRRMIQAEKKAKAQTEKEQKREERRKPLTIKTDEETLEEDEKGLLDDLLNSLQKTTISRPFPVKNVALIEEMPVVSKKKSIRQAKKKTSPSALSPMASEIEAAKILEMIQMS